MPTFIHTSRGGQAGPYAVGAGEVMQRLLADKSRFDFMVNKEGVARTYASLK